jgi:aspartyl-tRNA(Asn)/glutamyl-tRNA(Gln) amidotransferase subunit B
MAVERSIDFEIKRQVEMIESGGKVVQETRGWNEDKGKTFSQRVKETAMDYRYFPEPDLPPVEISEKWLNELRLALPESPRARRLRYRSEYGLNENYANMLVTTPGVAEYFEKVIKIYEGYGSVANWLLQETVDLEVKPKDLAEFVRIVDDKVISSTMGKEVLKLMNETKKNPSVIMEEKGMRQITDTGEISAVVDKVIAANEKAVADYKSGKVAVIGYLVGQAMKETKGQAEPGTLRKLFEEKMGS